jgi:hypothetical protein
VKVKRITNNKKIMLTVGRDGDGERERERGEERNMLFAKSSPSLLPVVARTDE